MICRLSNTQLCWKDAHLCCCNSFSYPRNTAGCQTRSCHLVFPFIFQSGNFIIKVNVTGPWCKKKKKSEHYCCSRIWHLRFSALTEAKTLNLINTHTTHTHTHRKWDLGSNSIIAITASWPCVECNNGKGSAYTLNRAPQVLGVERCLARCLTTALKEHFVRPPHTHRTCWCCGNKSTLSPSWFNKNSDPRTRPAVFQRCNSRNGNTSSRPPCSLRLYRHVSKPEWDPG